LSLAGYPSYDARVLRQIKGLSLLQITGSGGPIKNPEALQVHSGLRELRLDNLGIDDDTLGHLLYTDNGEFPWANLQALRLANNQISFSFPHEFSTWQWPASLTVDLA